jgi:FKBP-type peptidyl-prolyl cis-trans isomerase 2
MTKLVKKYIMKQIKIGDTVKVHYTGKLEDGTVFDSSLVEGREPLETVLGNNMLIKGFENGLIGLSEGDQKTLEINPSEGYGEYQEEMVNEIPKENVPENVKVGEMLQGMSPMGPINVKVIDVKEETVVIDANHPLAGKKLIFDIEVVNIN